MDPTTIAFICAGLLGALVGSGELITRYRDEPLRALTSTPALFYILVNVLASVLAYWMMVYFDWTVAKGLTGGALLGMRVLVAGTASMALFRSSLFTVRVGDQDIAVGPSSFLQAIMAAADREVDRLRAVARARVVCKAMADRDHELTVKVLPAMCLALMQNLSDEERTQINAGVASVEKMTVLSPRVRSYLMGLIILDAIGEHGLESVVEALKNDLLPQAAAGGLGGPGI
jgi:hypothetical protein